MIHEFGPATLHLEITYTQALELHEYHRQNGWLNPKHETMNRMFNIVYKFLEWYERGASDEEIFIECPTCERVSTRLEWADRWRRCSYPDCNEQHKTILGDEL